MIYYELVKVIIYQPGLEKVIFNIVIRYYSISDSIISDWDLFFTLKF